MYTSPLSTDPPNAKRQISTPHRCPKYASSRLVMPLHAIPLILRLVSMIPLRCNVHVETYHSSIFVSGVHAPLQREYTRDRRGGALDHRISVGQDVDEID